MAIRILEQLWTSLKTKSKLSAVNYNGDSEALHEIKLSKSLSRSCAAFTGTLSTLTKVDKL